MLACLLLRLSLLSAILQFLPRDAMQARPISSCGVCLSVCVSVTLVDSVGNPPNGSVECRWGRQKLRFWANIWLRCVLSTLRPAKCYQHGAAGPWQVVTLIAVVSSGVCWWRETTTKCLWQEVSNVTPKTTEQHLIARSDKSVAYVTNNKRLYALDILYCWS